MTSRALELRDARAIAERNEEVNRRRMQQRGAGPLKVTDPAALERLWTELRVQQSRQKQEERQRESERALREGEHYKAPDVRQKQAQLAKAQFQNGEESQVIQTRFDPYKNYYQLLGAERCASVEEIKKLYKKLALAFHPDKQRHASEEQQEAIRLKFQEIREAFDVLIDEELRAIYDRVRDYMAVHGDRAIPALSPHEASLMRQGMGELSRLRRQGMKLKKHDSRVIEVAVSLENLNSGCTMTVGVVRHRVNDHGVVVECPKNFHLILRKGSADGTKIPFEREGDEHLDTHPGDLIFILKQETHPLFKRIRKNDVEHCCPAAEPRQVLYFREVQSIYGRTQRVEFSPVMEALKAGGRGGTWESIYIGQGLFNSDDPWDNPPGDFSVKVRFPPVTALQSCVFFTPLIAVASREDTLGGMITACILGDFLMREQLAIDMQSEEESAPSYTPTVVCLHAGLSSAGVAIMTNLAATFPSAQVFSFRVAQGRSLVLMDDEFLRLSEAKVIILDVQQLQKHHSTTSSSWTSQLHHDFSISGTKETRTGDHSNTEPTLWPSMIPVLYLGDPLRTPLLHLFSHTLPEAAAGVVGGKIFTLQSRKLEVCTSPHTFTHPERQLGHEGADVVGVGFLKESVTVVDGITHEAEQIIASTRDVIAATAMQNISDGFCPSYRFRDDFDDKGFSERCAFGCLDSDDDDSESYVPAPQ